MFSKLKELIVIGMGLTITVLTSILFYRAKKLEAVKRDLDQTKNQLDEALSVLDTLNKAQEEMKNDLKIKNEILVADVTDNRDRLREYARD